VVPRPTAGADQLTMAKIHAAASAFEAKICRHTPRYMAFLGKMAITALSRHGSVAWGLQAETFGGARTWVLPNPSGLNHSFKLESLVHAYREVRIAASLAH
jgi:double-stranded uracil-DNA glycosylase